eukprot:784418-Pelagomonas_calceolata.AAC.2
MPFSYPALPYQSAFPIMSFSQGTRPECMQLVLVCVGSSFHALKATCASSVMLSARATEGHQRESLTPCWLFGRMRELSDAERVPLRDAFLAKYPTAFWVDFADFK